MKFQSTEHTISNTHKSHQFEVSDFRFLGCFTASWSLSRIARLVVFVLALALTSQLHAALVISAGEASFTFNEGTSLALDEFDAYFNDLATRSQTLSDAAPGNAAFTETASDVSLLDPIRPFGDVPIPFPGTPGSTRTRQLTTLEIENPGDVLSSWSTSDDAFGFVGGVSLGEQIALTSMQRWSGPLLYGDFALRNTGSKLVLTSNIDFLNAEFADIGNPMIGVTGNTLTITGDLLIGEAQAFLDPSAPVGTDFGDITFTATLTAVPEPSSMLLLAVGTGAVAIVRRRRKLSLTANA